MSRPLEKLLRHCLLTLALTSTAAIAAESSAARSYSLPAGPLSTTLNLIASQAGIALTLDPSLASGRTSAPCRPPCAAPACNCSRAAPAPTA